MLHYVPFTALPIQIATSPPQLDIRGFMGGIKADVAYIDQPLFSARACGLANINIYRPTDLVEGFVIRSRQRKLLEVVDGIIATSDHVLQALQPTRNIPSIVMSNGVDLDHFEPSIGADAPRRGVVYVGAIDKRFDWHQVEAAAQLNPDVAFDIYGPTSVTGNTLPLNVYIKGPVEYAALPHILRQYRVGILPLTTAPLNLGRSPMKLFEYLAAGLQVVATLTPTLLQQAGNTHGISLVPPDKFASAVASALGPPLAREDLIAEARRHSWSGKAEMVAAFAKEVSNPNNTA
ncbi:glycosyltransferase [Mycolicibacterium gilvum]|uniref:glycosyltransferase n=1 Tax=Mycolicibacterium gilvum TaxID=1804 RepID=UPI004045BF55